MSIYNKLEKEKRSNLWKIFFPIAIFAAAGYFLYLLAEEGFFVGWEVFFSAACYTALFAMMLIFEFNVIKYMHYRIYFDKNIVKIKDSFFSRVISIPAERVYCIDSIKKDKLNYDTILITDKKINHNKIRKLTADDFAGEDDRISIINELGEIFPDKVFYYYQVQHKGYKFFYYFYILYKRCEKCKFTGASMELVKGALE